MPGTWRYLTLGGENEGEHVTAAIAAAPVSKICFWERSTGTKIITAFNVAWANGKESATYGDTHGATKTVLKLRYGEFFKEVRLYSTMAGNTKCFSGWIGTTNMGRVVNIGYTKDLSYWTPPRLHSGLCVGFEAHINERESLLNRGGICLLEALEHVVIKMNYVSLPNAEINSVLVDDTRDENDGETPLEVHWTGTIELINEFSTLKTSAEELGVTTTVLTSNSTSYSVKSSTTLSRFYEVPPRRKYRRTTVYFQGTFKVQFRPQYTLTTRLGHTVQWPEGPAQDAFGVASGNLHIRISDITNDAKVFPIDPPRYTENPLMD
ncbi:hypothetical protein NYO67_12858 [Aspergillus flavus]|nr:hypothetical protein NYO67_12858 [Aspergillus flavus]